MMRMFLAATMVTAALLGNATVAAAQANYPEKPLQLILPFPAGGASDVIGRIIASELESRQTALRTLGTGLCTSLPATKSTGSVACQ